MSHDAHSSDGRVQLERIAFYGRTLSEYLKMFGFDDVISLKKYSKILDCPSGASSFVSEASRYAINAFACDPLYNKDAGALAKQGENDIEFVVKRVSETPQFYNWDFYSSITELLKAFILGDHNWLS